MTSLKLLFFSSSESQIYIGLTDDFAEGTWTWVDGTKIQYENWAPNKPGSSTSKNCVELVKSTGQWRDNYCWWRYAKHFICKKTYQGKCDYHEANMNRLS